MAPGAAHAKLRFHLFKRGACAQHPIDGEAHSPYSLYNTILLGMDLHCCVRPKTSPEHHQHPLMLGVGGAWRLVIPSPEQGGSSGQGIATACTGLLYGTVLLCQGTSWRAGG